MTKELTIGQMLGCTNFPLEIVYNDGRDKYVELDTGFWFKYGFNINGKIISYENSKSYWYKFEYDSNGNVILFQKSDGYWHKYERDSNGNLIYFEDSDGNIEDNRPKVELSLKDIADKFGIPLSQLRVKE